MKDHKVGYIDKTGSFVVEPQYDAWSEELSTFTEGLTAVQKNKLWGFINKNGEVVIPIEYENVSAFNDGLASVRKSGAYTWGYIDKEGNWAIPAEYSLAWKFSEGLARVEIKGKPHVIDRTGKVQFTLPEDFSWAEPFSEGLTKVEIRNKADRSKKIGYINRSGEYAIPPEFEWGSSFKNGLATVMSCGKTGYIDKTGARIWGLPLSKNFASLLEGAPPSSTVKKSLILKITKHPGPIEIETLPASDTCGPLGKILWSLHIKGDPKTFNDLTINLLEGDTFLTEERVGHFEATYQSMTKLGRPPEQNPFRRIEPRQGVVGYASVLGFGPGGAMYGLSVPSPDKAYELQILMAVSGEGNIIEETKATKKYFQKLATDPVGLTNSLAIVLYDKLFPAP